MPRFRHRETGVVINVPAEKARGPEWESAEPSQKPPRPRPSRKQSSDDEDE